MTCHVLENIRIILGFIFLGKLLSNKRTVSRGNSSVYQGNRLEINLTIELVSVLNLGLYLPSSSLAELQNEASHLCSLSIALIHVFFIAHLLQSVFIYPRFDQTK